MHFHPFLVTQALDAAIDEQAIARFKAQGGQIETDSHGDICFINNLALFTRSYREATAVVMANYSPKEQL